MGISSGVNIFFNFNFDISFSELIDILSIVVNSFLAIWIVKTIQNKLNNKRVLKDHFISEIKDLRSEYNDYLRKLSYMAISPKGTPRFFKYLDIKKNHLLNDLGSIYCVKNDKLNLFHSELRELITNCEEFTENYREDNEFSLRSKTKAKLDRIQIKYNGIFNELIISVNDCNK